MERIHLTRDFLKKPLYTVGLLMGVILLMEGLGWAIAYNSKLSILVKHGGTLPYVSLLIRSLILPEIVTVIILNTLLNQQHVYLRLNSVGVTLRDISRYELSFLPTILLSFFVFNPITETLRFFLESYPDYTLTTYWETYLSGTFTISVYLRYLVPIFFIGYVTLNISLVSDYLKQRQAAQEAAESKAAKAVEQAQAFIAAQSNSLNNVTSPYLTSLKGKNSQGELDFPVEDVYFFTIEDRYYYAQLEKGQYLVTKTLNDLETELDPTRFFRIKRDYIVNRQSVLNYAYWENGKYIVRLSTPDRHEIVVPRARMQEFREWLQGNTPSNNQQPYADTSPDPVILVS